MSAMKSVNPPAAERHGRAWKAAVKKVHARARELDMDDAVRRDLQRRVTGVESCAEMSLPQLDAVLREMQAGGPPPHRRADSPHARKCRALWLSLWHLGALRDGSERALDAFVARQTGQTGVEALRFLGGRDADTVIEALKDWCKRIGFEVPAEAPAAKRALLWAQWQRLAALGAVGLAKPEALDAWLQWKVTPGRSAVSQLTGRQLDQAAALLGDWIRQVATARGETVADGQ